MVKTACHARRISCSRALVLLLPIAALTSILVEGKELRVTKVSSIPVQWRKNALLQDVCADGLVLLDAMGFPKEDPSLLMLWDLERGKPALQVNMDAWNKHAFTVSGGVLSGSDGDFRCRDGGKQVVASTGAYLALFEVERPQDIAWVLPSADLHESPPQLSHGVDHLITHAWAVNPANGLIAAAYNRGAKRRIFVYTADLKSVIRTWEFSQFVQDISWSCDGKRLAVLYSGEIDGNGKFVGSDPNFHPLGIPDVEILDPASGKSQLRFFSGDRESKVAFSPDATRLWTISLRDQGKKEGAVRMFSASTGDLVKTITSGRYQLHNNFGMSPDGRLIVADASTPAPNLLLNAIRYGERALYIKMARFVILDAKTGEVLFEHHEETAGPGYGIFPMRFGFSPDGRRLLVDPNFAGCADNERVDVYSLDGLRQRSTSP